MVAAAVALSPSTSVTAGGEAPQPSEPLQTSAQQTREAWVGGADGGVWVLLRRTGDRTFFGCIIHDDGRTVWYRGGFRLDEPSRTATSLNALSFAGWDGSRLLLAGGGHLDPVDPVRVSYDDVDEPRQCLQPVGSAFEK